MDGFQHPIFSGAGEHNGSDYLDNDLDDIFVDDFMSGGDDSSALPTMGFDDLTTPLAPFSNPMQPASLPITTNSAQHGIFMPNSNTIDTFQAPQAQLTPASGAALLQQSAYASNAASSTSASAATLAGIAANPETSKYVASAALAATRAAEHISGSEAQTANQSAELEASKPASSNRARRTSARAATEKIKEVVAEERSSVKRPHEPSAPDSDEDDDGDEDDDDAGPGRGKRRRSMNQSERQARRYGALIICSLFSMPTISCSQS